MTKQYNVVYYWNGGTTYGRWLAAYSPKLFDLIVQIERRGRVAYPGNMSIGPPDGPPDLSELTRVGFCGLGIARARVK